MLAMRMQRTGRKGHAMFRVIVQDARRSPSSGRVVATLGHYDPHTKALTLQKEKAAEYLKNGAQPSDRVARLLKNEGIKLPSWVTLAETKQRAIRNPEKLRRNRPAEEVQEKPAEEAATETEEQIESKTEEATAVEAAAPTPEETEKPAETQNKD